MQGIPYFYLEACVRGALYSFRNSILFFPVLLAVGGIALFAITSSIDQSVSGIEAGVPPLDWLLFAGSPHAARSVLSTVAAGWATILGVAFSVTLISLQLSVTKHTAEVIDEFESDRLNQVMIGWFVSTVIYSLLVLKTVRTGEDGASPFVPAVGVNVALLMAVVALFIFVAFLNNVGKYLKPPLLIDRIQTYVIRAINQYDARQVDRAAAFAGTPHPIEKLFAVESPRRGVLRRIDLDKIHQKVVGDGSGSYCKVWIKFHARLGEHVLQGTPVATVYAVPDRGGYGAGEGGRSGSSSGRSIPRDGTFKGAGAGIDGNGDGGGFEKGLQRSIASALDVSQNRDLFTDPSYGIEVLRNIAVKSASQSDINSIKSCVEGLFTILSPAFMMADMQTNPLKAPGSGDPAQNKGGGAGASVIIDLNERPAFETALSALAAIYGVCLQSAPALGAVLEQYVGEYALLADDLLARGGPDKFAILTEWYAGLLSATARALPTGDRNVQNVKAALQEFRRSLAENHPYAVDMYDVNVQRAFAVG